MKIKRIVSIALVLITIFTILPLSTFEAFAASENIPLSYLRPSEHLYLNYYETNTFVFASSQETSMGYHGTVYTWCYKVLFKYEKTTGFFTVDKTETIGENEYVNWIVGGDKMAVIAWADSTYSSDLASLKVGDKVKLNGVSFDYLKNSTVLNKRLSNVYLSFLGSGDFLDSEASRTQIKNQLSNVNIDNGIAKGAEVEVLGYKFPLVTLPTNIKLNIGENLHFEIEGTTAKVLLGFDENASANIQGANKSDTYWSDSYREVKSLYTKTSGKQVDTTRLWNDFSKLRGKLKKTSGTVMINVNASLAGYMEFKYANGKWGFVEGGVVASLEAGFNFKHSPVPPAPIYIIYGINGTFDGMLSFIQKEKIVPQFASNLGVTISAGINVGVKGTYVQGDVYGTLLGQLNTASTQEPIRLGLDVGARWEGYLFGHELFSDSISFKKVEFYPDYGTTWNMARFALTPNIDASNVDCYRDLINSGTPIDRSYLASAYSLRSSTGRLIGAEFVKNNAYPLSEPSLVSFDNGNMLLVWVDDDGTKTQENMCTLMYSYFDGTEWSTPDIVYEDGTYNDMPSIYSDGTYAYMAWQKATKKFEEGVETTEMLENFDIYATVFDSISRTFGDVIAINPEDDTNFEMNSIIRGENGSFTVAWFENSDNNIYQLSGNNSLYTANVDENGNLVSTDSILETSNMFNDIELADDGVLYSLFETDKTNLYRYNGGTTLLFEAINSFEEEDGLIYYTTADGFYTYNGVESIKDASMSSLDDFVIKSNGNDIVMFATVLNEDFTKSLYYSEYSAETSEWGDFELYSNEGRYIRNYSPIVLADGTSLVAFNYVTEFEDGTESASIVVGKCTDETDVQVTYVDFDEAQLDSGDVDFKMGVKNYSSALIESFNVSISDNTGTVVHTETVSKTLAPFGEDVLSVNFTIPEGYTNELYTFTVLPEGYSDYDEENNARQTTFERILRPADYTAYLEALGLTENLVETDYTSGSWNTLAGAMLIDVSEKLDIEQKEVDSATEAIVNAFESLTKGILGDVDENGIIDSVDYIQVKRFVLYIYELEVIPKLRADINNDGEIAIIDYLAIKRAVMGTYVIGG